MNLNQEHMDGYLDGRDLDCPWPGDNRSHSYRHSFEVGRLEVCGDELHWTAPEARTRARIANLKDQALGAQH